MNKKLNVVVLMGGSSAEHEVSLASGKMVLGGLDKNKYNVKSIMIGKDGKWLLPLALRPAAVGLRQGKSVSVKALPARLESGAPAHNEKSLVATDGGRAIERIKLEDKADVVFIALHGTFGEDGKIQGLLELAGIPYTGSGVLASALGMNKAMTKKVLRSEKILMAADVILRRDFKRSDAAKIKLPAAVKPNEQGSSVGVSIVKTRSELEKAIKEAFSKGSSVLVEEFIRGREITAAVLGNDKPRALPLIEIRPKAAPFFDYRAKYEAGGSEEICPAPLSKALTIKIQEIAARVHKILGCRGATRSDFILRGTKPYFLEINTLPGMTATSLVPQAAAKAGISFGELVDELIELAIER